MQKCPAGPPVGLAASQRLHKRSDDSVTGPFTGSLVGQACSQKSPISGIREAESKKYTVQLRQGAYTLGQN